jgi:hypothetical protein
MTLAGLALAALAVAGPAEAGKPKPLFASSDMIHVTVKGAFLSLSRAKAAAGQTVPGVLTVQGSAPETLPITLSLRGITRRLQEICSFPPLRVEFTEKPGATSLFKGQKRLKLVTHCQSAPEFQQHLLLEYTAYRLYNQLTPYSFNARLATVDYVDDKGKAIASRVGFFLEDADDVAQRNDLDRIRIPVKTPLASLSPKDAARVAMFEDMIGNLDWAMTAGPAGTDCCHNTRLLGPEGATTNLIPTPYDFDYSGLVDAPYAVAPAGINLPNVRVRRYRGYCRHNSEAQAVAADMTAKRAALLAIVDQTPKLDEGARHKAASYLNSFFDQIGNAQGLATMQKACLAG